MTDNGKGWLTLGIAIIIGVSICVFAYYTF